MRPHSCKRPGAGTTVLLVDDEEKFRASIAMRLRMRGYMTLEAGNKEEAVRALETRPEIRIAVLDHRMQGGDARRVLAEMKKRRPGIPAILLTGLSRLDPALDSCRNEFFAVLEKPCDLEQLIGAMEDALCFQDPERDEFRIPPEGGAGTGSDGNEGMRRRRQGR